MNYIKLHKLYPNIEFGQLKPGDFFIDDVDHPAIFMKVGPATTPDGKLCNAFYVDQRLLVHFDPEWCVLPVDMDLKATLSFNLDKSADEEAEDSDDGNA